MVRLDRTIGLPKLALTDLFVPMVRSIPRLDRGRTMTKGEGATRSSHYFSEYGVEHEDEATGLHDRTSVSARVRIKSAHDSAGH
jgi:hypothetical protein